MAGVIKHSMLAPSLAEARVLSDLTYRSIDFNPANSVRPADGVFWNDRHYGLSRSTLFQSLKEEQRLSIVSRLSTWSLSLSYFIEKFGLHYGAKMILSADSAEEKSLYALFTGDEVRHRLWMEPYLGEAMPTDISIHPLLSALALCLEEGTKDAMVFTIQVVLEGFGISHYSALRDTCQCAGLRDVFSAILRDEAFHHGMGVTLASKMHLDEEARAQVDDLTLRFARALVEADWITKSVETELDGLSAHDRQQLRDDIQWETQILKRAERLGGLVSKVGRADLAARIQTEIKSMV